MKYFLVIICALTICCKSELRIEFDKAFQGWLFVVPHDTILDNQQVRLGNNIILISENRIDDIRDVSIYEKDKEIPANRILYKNFYYYKPSNLTKKIYKVSEMKKILEYYIIPEAENESKKGSFHNLDTTAKHLRESNKLIDSLFTKYSLH